MPRHSFESIEPLSLPTRNISLWQLGHGPGVVFLLPGYRQRVKDWEQWLDRSPDGWKIILIGMPGSVIKATATEPVWKTSDWLTLVATLRERFIPEKEAWLGYSLGGRLLLHMAGLSSGINQVLLMSPDGLDPSLSERLFLYHKWGQKPMRWLIRNPQKATWIANRLRAIRLMSKSGHYFALRQLREAESLISGYEVVRIYTEAKPRPGKLRQADRAAEVSVWAIWGDQDQVRPVSQGRKLWKYFRNVRLTTVPGGHVWPASHPELLSDWLTMALDHASNGPD